jgi:methionyl-tRNA synthetase
LTRRRSRKECPDHKSTPDKVSEQNIFFRLSGYQDKLAKVIETDVVKIIPQAKKSEILFPSRK